MSETRFKTMADMERDHIKAALELCNWRVYQATKLLGISPSTIYRLIKKYGIVRG